MLMGKYESNTTALRLALHYRYKHTVITKLLPNTIEQSPANAQDNLWEVGMVTARSYLYWSVNVSCK